MAFDSCKVNILKRRLKRIHLTSKFKLKHLFLNGFTMVYKYAYIDFKHLRSTYIHIGKQDAVSFAQLLHIAAPYTNFLQ